MRIDVVTLFPRMFGPMLETSIVGRTVEKGLLTVDFTDPRDHTHDRHRVVDDRPFGGEGGMVLKPEPFFEAFDALEADGLGEPHLVLLTPRGRLLNQEMARTMSLRERVVLVCGHYKGVDERVATRCHEEVSIGDYVLSGGEVAAMVIIDAVARLLPGAVSDFRSVESDSHYQDLLSPPEYTRPEVYRGLAVPEVLRTGHHAKIEDWKHREAVRLTRERRPELLRRHTESRMVAGQG